MAAAAAKADPKGSHSSRDVSGSASPVGCRESAADRARLGSSPLACTGRLGDRVRVYSDSAQAWVEAHVVDIELGQRLRVEYILEGQRCGKWLHVDSPNVDFSSAGSDQLPQPQARQTGAKVDPSAWSAHSGLKQTQLHAASRLGDESLVESLLLHRMDPAACDEKTQSTALHVAVYHGHLSMVDLLLQDSACLPGLLQQKNMMGETPLDVARERVRLSPENEDAVHIFARLFGRDPSAQERAGRTMGCASGQVLRTVNQNYVEAVAMCPLIGDRSEPFSFDQSAIDEMVAGIREEEQRVLKFERKEYNDWFYWRASFLRGMRRHSVDESFLQRESADKMGARLLEASSKGSGAEREEALRRCAIGLYTCGTFLVKAVSYAMHGRREAEDFKHLRPYAHLLNDAAQFFAKAQPWKGRAHRVLPIDHEDALETYRKLGALSETDPNRDFTWSGFVSATVWEEPCKILEDLAKYGAGKPCLIFDIDPDPHGLRVYPIDLRDMASFGAQDRELLYPAKQIFRVEAFEELSGPAAFRARFALPDTASMDLPRKVFVVKLTAVDTFRGDYFKDEGDLKKIEQLLRNRLDRSTATEDKDDTKSMLAECLRQAGKFEDAEQLFREALHAQRATLGGEHPSTLASANNLALTLQARGDSEGAEHLLREVLHAQRAELGEEHPSTLLTKNNLAGVLKTRGDLRGAEQLLMEVLRVRQATLGEEHPDTLTTKHDLACTLFTHGDLKGAEQLLMEVLRGFRAALGEEHPITLASKHNLAGTLFARGDVHGAEHLYRDALRGRRATLGEEHPSTLASKHNLAGALFARGDLQGAEQLLSEALRGRQAKLGEEHPHTLASKRDLAKVLEVRGG